VKLRGISILLLLSSAGCAGNPSALDPAGPGAKEVASLTWVFLGVSLAVYLLTLAVFFWSVRRGAGAARNADEIDLNVPPERGKSIIIGAALIATVGVLTVLVGFSYWTDRALTGIGGKPAVEIEVTAHRWWWEIRYRDPAESRGFVTANELHVPLNEPVKITLNSADVIHSFWVPNITGKRDIIPGRTQEIMVKVDRPGSWIGRCSEYCGLQHANMAFRVVAEPRAAFDAWRDAQAQPSRTPTTSEEVRGQQVFSEASCVLCHVIRGSPAAGYSATAPDLTHLKSRSTIAAGAFPNHKGYLAGWVADAPNLKPGVLMPVNMLPPADFQALIAYLETLK
jgi:cytochrome c oxidase subunit 2